MAAGIECPRCKGRVGIFFKGESLETALARHEQLTHGSGPVKPKAPQALAAIEESPAPPAPPRKRLIRRPK